MERVQNYLQLQNGEGKKKEEEENEHLGILWD